MEHLRLDLLIATTEDKNVTDSIACTNNLFRTGGKKEKEEEVTPPVAQYTLDLYTGAQYYGDQLEACSQAHGQEMESNCLQIVSSDAGTQRSR